MKVMCWKVIDLYLNKTKPFKKDVISMCRQIEVFIYVGLAETLNRINYGAFTSFIS